MKKKGSKQAYKAPASPAKPPQPMKATKGGSRAKAVEDRYGNVPIR